MSYFYTLHTLVDITRTDVMQNKMVPIFGLKDRVGQPIDSEQNWNISRNQQRNWETIIQLLGLRTQPTIRDPQKLTDQKLKDFDFDPVYGEIGSVWKVSFSTETEDVFKIGDDPIALLKHDFEKIPIITNLEETVIISPSLIITSLPKNTNFTFLAI